MSMKPILFNTEMVKAIMDGRKTVTRRIADINTDITCNDGTTNHDFVLDDFSKGTPTGFVCRKCGFGVAPPHSRVPCGSSLFRPRYWPGDILYVRETWQKYHVRRPQKAVPVDFKETQYLYRADGEVGNTDGSPFKWRPSIHMPKEAARIFLRVKRVSVERLQEITADQVAAEGIDSAVPCDDAEELCNYCPLPDEAKGVHCYGGAPAMCEGKCCPDATEIWEEDFIGEFAELWDSTIKPADLPTYGWEANPWVWVIEFERCEKPKEVGDG